MLNAVVDLSHWNQSVNFKLAKGDGIVGTICKATTATESVDPTYYRRRSAATEEGLLWGAYHFGTGTDGKSQADHFLDVVGDTSKTLIALDLEMNPFGETITPEQADYFVKRVYEVVGRYPVVYGSENFLKDFGNTDIIKCPLWIASYANQPKLPKYWNQWVLWQYTDGNNGPEPHEIAGIGVCHRNMFNGATVEDLKQFWHSGSR